MIKVLQKTGTDWLEIAWGGTAQAVTQRRWQELARRERLDTVAVESGDATRIIAGDVLPGQKVRMLNMDGEWVWQDLSGF